MPWSTCRVRIDSLLKGTISMSQWRTIGFLLAILTLIVGFYQAQARGPQPTRNQPGVFDYYVLSLSWSPEYCAASSGTRDPQQCGVGRRYGFVVHGLWPQYEKGFPASCPGNTQVEEQTIQRLLPIMPSVRLIRHEWRKHGTCSGLTTEQYFTKLEDAYALVTIPQQYRHPNTAMTVTLNRLKQDFISANPLFTARTFAPTCQGRFLSEVRVCLSKDLQPRTCSRDVRDACRSQKITLRPVR